MMTVPWVIVNSHFRLCVWFRRQVWCSKRSTRQVCCWLGAPWENWEARVAEGLQGRIRGPVWPSEWPPRQVCRRLGPPGKTHQTRITKRFSFSIELWVSVTVSSINVCSRLQKRFRRPIWRSERPSRQVCCGLGPPRKTHQTRVSERCSTREP